MATNLNEELKRNAVPTATESYQQSMQLQEMQDKERRRLAEQTAAEEKRRLSEQLAEQRRNYMRSQGQLARQSESVNSQLLRQLSGRGMATGGLLQLGDIQGRMATGQGMSNIAEQDRLTRLGLGREQAAVAQNYQSAMNQADIEKLYSQAQLGKEVRGEQRQDSTMMLEMLSSAISMLPEEQRTPELMNQFASLLANFGTSIGQGALGEEMQEQIGSITEQLSQGGLPEGQTGSVTARIDLRNTIIPSTVGDNRTALGKMYTSTELENLNPTNEKLKYKVAGETIELTPLQMIKYIEDRYSSTLKDDISVTVGIYGTIAYRTTDGKTHGKLSDARRQQDALNTANK